MNYNLQAIEFLTKQQSYNKENIDVLNKLGIETKELVTWDSLYNYIINVLKEI